MSETQKRLRVAVSVLSIVLAILCSIALSSLNNEGAVAAAEATINQTQ